MKNREIKFRAWDPKNNKMICDNTDYFIEFDVTLWRCTEDKNGNEHMTFADESIIVMQSTGMKDKNGKEIYEGDILKAESGNLFEVMWENDLAGFRLRNKWDEDVVQQNRFPVRVGLEKMQEFEVIGNLFENPELIK